MKATLVSAVFVTIVPEAEPKVYDRVWVKEDDALVMVIVLSVPITVEFVEMLTVDALAMLVNAHAELEVTVCVATTPAEEQVADILPDAIVLVPSVPWVTVVVPEAIFTELFCEQEYCEEEEYALSRIVVPSMMTLHPILIVEKYVFPLSSHTSYAMVEVLLVTFVAVSSRTILISLHGDDDLLPPVYVFVLANYETPTHLRMTSPSDSITHL